jgi:hypothetical protein
MHRRLKDRLRMYLAGSRFETDEPVVTPWEATGLDQTGILGPAPGLVAMSLTVANYKTYVRSSESPLNRDQGAHSFPTRSRQAGPHSARMESTDPGYFDTHGVNKGGTEAIKPDHRKGSPRPRIQRH